MKSSSRRRILGFLGGLGAVEALRPHSLLACCFRNRARYGMMTGGTGAVPQARTYSPVYYPDCTDASLDYWDEANGSYALNSTSYVTFSGVFPGYYAYSLQISSTPGHGQWVAPYEGVTYGLTQSPYFPYVYYTKLRFQVNITAGRSPAMNSDQLDFTVTSIPWIGRRCDIHLSGMVNYP